MATNCVVFQSKLTSIMEIFAKAAVVEISKLWEDGFNLVQVELRRRESEIEALNRKLMMMEKERCHTTRPIIDSVQTLCSDPSVREKADTSANHQTSPSQTEEIQCEQLKSDLCLSDDDDDEDLIVKLEEEDDVQIVEQTVETDHSVNDGHLELEVDLQPVEAMEEQESQQWSSVSVGDSDTADDSDCFFEPKQLAQHLDSEILLIQNALDIFESSSEAAYSDRFMRDDGQGASSKSTMTLSQAQPSQTIEAINQREECPSDDLSSGVQQDGVGVRLRPEDPVAVVEVVVEGL
ncbi:hypothetical protein F7725_011126 [Dissostichus mawsoni]|uniref:Uncharacterized protein n=1 Tax=Dissostichus mawsoni TaxID=36200 RepID=A0A7J5Z865_DISMA|nr:hypothetical protein F7725_011126 [Dissostichus mawsoni]